MADASVDLQLATEHAAKVDKKGIGKDLARYAETSAEFAALGGLVGTAIPIPGVGTAMGALVGAGAGVAYEAASDILGLFEDEPKRKKESPEKAEAAFYTYQGMGGEKGTGLPYRQWWGLYVRAGRPSLEVLQATARLQRQAEREARGPREAPPPPPPPPVSPGTAAARDAANEAARRAGAKIVDVQRRPPGTVPVSPSVLAGSGGGDDLLLTTEGANVRIGRFVSDQNGEPGILFRKGRALQTGRFSAG